MDKVEDLTNIRNYLFTYAERLWLLCLSLAVIIHFFGIISLFIGDHTWIVIGGFLSFFGQAISTWIKEAAADNQNKADKCRRLILYSDGLGLSISSESIATAKHWVGLKEVKKSQYIKPYYSSILAPGPRRLADMVSESAYYTYCLADTAAKFMRGISIILFLTAIVMLLLAVETSPGNNYLVILGKSALVIIGFLFSGDILVLYKKYLNLSQKAHLTFQMLVRMKSKAKVKEQDVIQEVEDYNLEALQTPPIPSFLYLLKKDGLDKAYKSACGGDDKNG